MSGAEIVVRLRIADVFTALGGEVRGHRGRAFWRNGDGWSISLDDAKGAWFDHRDSAGGGIVSLVVKARECSRVEALKWLAELAGEQLDGQPSHGGAAYRAAIAEAQQVVARKHGAEEALREWRYLNQQLYYAIRNRILSGRLTGEDLGPAMDEGQMAEIRVAVADEALDAIKAANWDDMLACHRAATRPAQRRAA